MKHLFSVSLVLILLFLAGCGLVGSTESTPAPAPQLPTPEVQMPAPEVQTPQASTPEPPPAPTVSLLVGTWFFNDNLDLGLGYGVHNYDIFVTYNLDGTARQTHIYTGDIEWQMYFDFIWSSANGVGTSTITMGGTTITETWEYAIVGNVLTVHQDGITLIFQRFQ